MFGDDLDTRTGTWDTIGFSFDSCPHPPAGGVQGAGGAGKGVAVRCSAPAPVHCDLHGGSGHVTGRGTGTGTTRGGFRCTCLGEAAEQLGILRLTTGDWRSTRGDADRAV